MPEDFADITPSEQEFIDQLLADGRKPATIIRHARMMLQTARRGASQAAPYAVMLPPLREDEPMPTSVQDALHEVSELQQAGIHIAVVFGHATTMTIQNLRGKADGFNDWWATQWPALRADELARYFYVLRSVILKEGYLGGLRVSLAGGVDATGNGSGLLETRLYNPPRIRSGETLDDLPTEKLLTLYLDTLESVIDEATNRWAPSGQTSTFTARTSWGSRTAEGDAAGR